MCFLENHRFLKNISGFPEIVHFLKNDYFFKNIDIFLKNSRFSQKS